LILSLFWAIPKGLFEPLRWRKNKWRPLIAAIVKGRRKCNVKNRVSEELSTANPPQKMLTIITPNLGITQIRFVITVAPQNLIWPQGRT